MRPVHGIMAAFSLFSAIPMPDSGRKDLAADGPLYAFPLVGLVTGLCWYLWALACGKLALPAILRGAGLCLLPVAVTGGIHLDGYADTWDALSSHAPPARRREILRDPHCGAFAVTRLCMYFTGFSALCAALIPGGRAMVTMGLAFGLSRALSGAALLTLPLSGESAFARALAAGGGKRPRRGVLYGEAILLAAGMVLSGGGAGVMMVLAALAVLGRCARIARRAFEGVSGDLAGWFLQEAEFWMLAVLVLCQYGAA